MSDNKELHAQTRDRVGKGASRELRRQNMVPAVIYGDKQAPLSIALPYKETFLAISGGGFMTTVFDVVVDGKKHRVLPKDYQLHPVKDFPLHVDFLRVAKGATVTVEIPLNIINEDISVGLKSGGALNIVRHTVEVECPADAIPESLTVDLANVEVGDAVHISAVDLPKDVVPTITDRDFTVVTIAAPGGGAASLDEDEGEVVDPGEVPADNGGDEDE